MHNMRKFKGASQRKPQAVMLFCTDARTILKCRTSLNNLYVNRPISSFLCPFVANKAQPGVDRWIALAAQRNEKSRGVNLRKNASKTSCTAGRRLRKRKCYKARCPAALQQPRARAGQVTAGAIDTRADRLIPPAPLLRRRVSREAFFGVRVVGRSVVYPGNRLVVVVSDIQRFTLSQHPKYKAAAGF